jgi:hypothetical protein
LSAAEKRDYVVISESRQLLFYAFLKFFIAAFSTSCLNESFKTSSTRLLRLALRVNFRFAFCAPRQQGANYSNAPPTAQGVFEKLFKIIYGTPKIQTQPQNPKTQSRPCGAALPAFQPYISRP